MRLRGFVEAEVLLAAALLSMFVVAITGSFYYAQQSAVLFGGRTAAIRLLDEGAEAARNIRDGAFNELIYDQSAVETSGGQWIFSGEGTDETIGDYTRTITFEEVCRDASEAITTCPGDHVDIETQEVTVTIDYTTFLGVTQSLSRDFYVTNWRGVDWVQSDWSGGDGQTIWVSQNKYDNDDGNLEVQAAGEVTLLNGEPDDPGFDVTSDTDSYDWPFTTPSNYIYDTADIEVTGGVAQLKSGAATLEGDTLNPDFDVDSSYWTYNDWEETGGRVIGSHQATGGSPNGYVDITIDEAKNRTLSGYWEQPFTTLVDNPTTATLDLDWIIDTYDGSFVTSFQVYAFVDSSSGSPSVGTQVWSSGEITGTTSWASISTVDVSSSLGAAGTYYLKIAARVITGGGGGPASGEQVIGFDNVDLHWESATTAYPTDEPEIYPTTDFTVATSGTWSAFVETSSKGTGEIYYQLSDDSGTTWQYWNGSSWATAGAADYNTATEVNSNIASFNSAAGTIRFKAFLESNGVQQIQLDNVYIEFTESGSPWTFVTWDVDGGEETPTGSLQTTGGNPDGYADVTVLAGNNDEVGGLWKQSFTNYKTNPTPVTLDFDYKVFTYTGTPDLAEIRIYIDTADGDPVTQVGSSISLTGTGSWIAASQYDLSSAVTATGDYYLKVVLYVETGTGGGSGPFNVGFDNVSLDLGDGAHPLSGTLTSSAFDTGATSQIQIIEWDEDMSICDPNCDIDFEVRAAPDSGGSPGTWSSWYGATGSGTTFDDANGTLISTDLNGNQWIQYRVELTSDGVETPVLDEVRINYLQ